MTFEEKLVEKLNEYYPGKVGVQDITKKNKTLRGITIKKTNEIKVVVYVEDYLGWKVDEAIEDILKRVDNSSDLSKDIEKNKEDMLEILNNWEDYLLYSCEGRGIKRPIIHFPNTPYFTGSIPEHNYSSTEMMDMAVDNFINNYVEIHPIFERILAGRAKNGGVDFIPDELPFDEPITVEGHGISGCAEMILTPTFLNFFCNKYDFKNIYIIPSSIHEVIIINAEDERLPADELLEMVKVINSEEVKPEDVYGNYLFHFTRGNKLVETCF